MSPPASPRGPVVDDFFGTPVADPYRWLEEADSPATRAWIEAQNAHTERVLEGAPGRAAIEARLRALWDHPRVGTPSRHGEALFYYANSGLQEQAVLHVRQGDTTRVLLDPNTLSADGTISLAMTAISPSGRLLGWSTSDGGSDWQVWRVRDVASGQDAPDTLRWIKFSGIAWDPDERGFFYARFPAADSPLEAANHHNRVYHHTLGEPQEADVLVYEDPAHPTYAFWPTLTRDGSLLLLSISDGTEPKNRVYLRPLGDPAAPFRKLFDAFDAAYTFLGKVGPRLYFSSTRDAPKGNVLVVDLDQGDEARVLIPEGPHPIEAASLVGGRLFLTTLVDVVHVVSVYDLDGAFLRTLPLPGLGAVAGFGGDEDAPETFYAWSGFLAPPQIFALSLPDLAATPWAQAAIDFDPSPYTVTQRFVSSRDGARVPVFLLHRRGLPLDGAHPTQLYGYGGFHISLTPSFSVERAVWLEMGGVYAIANLRGGGEYGAAWHDAGRLQNKQNTFDDLYAVAEDLIAAGYTRPDRLAVSGGSNGGLLVGAAITQRPDLFAAALPAVGVLDMLRYHLFTIGWAWASDYGRADDPAMFPVLHAYSPLHNLKEGVAYPATLITTGDHDDRVVPAHSFKFAAALQQAQGGPAPILIRVETRGGHGAGRSTTQRITETADRWAFLAQVLAMGPRLFTR